MCFRPVVSTRDNKCPKCGKDNEPDATVCVECGASLEEPAPPPGQVEGAPPTPPTSGRPGGAPPVPSKPPTPPVGK